MLLLQKIKRLPGFLQLLLTGLPLGLLALGVGQPERKQNFVH